MIPGNHNKTECTQTYQTSKCWQKIADSSRWQQVTSMGDKTLESVTQSESIVAVDRFQ